MLRKREGSEGGGFPYVGGVVVWVLEEGLWLRVLLKRLAGLVCLLSSAGCEGVFMLTCVRMMGVALPHLHCPPLGVR